VWDSYPGAVKEKDSLLELRRMLFDDALGQHIGHVQNLFMHFVKRGKRTTRNDLVS